MTPKKREELHAWIAEKVMGWKREGKLCPVWESPEDGSAIMIKDWCPTTNKAQAMDVLEKCCDNRRDIAIKFSIGCWWVRTPPYGNDTEEMFEASAEADTLPETICLFARELFK